MLSLFRTNQVIFNLFLLLYAIGLRLSSFIRPLPEATGQKGILPAFFKDLLGGNQLFEGITAILLLFIQAIIINNLAMKHRLFNEMTLLPGLFYILLMSILQDFFLLSPILFGNLFLIVALDELMSTYKKAKCIGHIFNAGFWIGVASLFHISFSFFFILIFFGIGMLRSFKIREYWVLLSGFLIPFLFTVAWFFWYDMLSQFWQVHFLEQFSFLSFQYEQTPVFLIKLLLIFLFFVLGFFNNYPFNKTHKTRSYVQLIYFTLLTSGLTFLFQPNVTILHFLIIMVPLSLLVTARFLAFSSSFAELLHAFLLIVILFFQYQGFNYFF